MKGGKLPAFVVYLIFTGCSIALVSWGIRFYRSLSALDVDHHRVKVEDVATSQKLEYTFQLTNRSKTQAIFIENIEKSCNCTSVEFNRKVIPAGKTVALPVGMTIDEREGLHEARIIVHWRVGQGKIRYEELMLSAIAQRVVDLEPRMVDFGNLDGEAKSILFSVTPNSGSFKEIQASVSADWVALTRVRSEPGIHSWNVVLSSKGIPVGNIKEKITLKILDSSGRSSEILVPVAGRRNGPLKAVPQTIYIGKIESGKRSGGQFVLKTESGVPFLVAKVTSSNGGFLSAFAAGQEAGISQNIFYNYDAGVLRGNQSGDIQVETLVGNSPLNIKVPFIVFVDEPAPVASLMPRKP